jgi:soluble cytochrome b562
MKKTLFLLGCAIGLSSFCASAEEEADTPLAKQMETMNDSYKAFRNETDPVKGAAKAREAQAATLKSALEIPELIKEMPEGPEKIKATLEYHKMMGKLFLTFCDVEEAFLNGKIEDVAKIVATLKDMRKAGHDKFTKEDE